MIIQHTPTNSTFRKIPKLDLINSPTPIQRLDALEYNVEHHSLWLKSEGLSGKLFGGNKIRNLEYLIPDAIRQNAKTLVTFGSIESNHALATSIYGKEFGFKVRLYLCNLSGKTKAKQTKYIDRLKKYGAEVSIVPLPVYSILSSLNSSLTTNGFFSNDEYVIPIGGATPLGCIGHFNLAREIKGQIINNEMPVPEEVFLAVGSGGTIAGLLAGFAHFDLPIKITGVYVSQGPSRKRIVKLATKVLNRATGGITNAKLQDLQRFSLTSEYKGEGYGIATPYSERAVRLLSLSENVKLDTSYTAKAMCAYLDRAKGTPNSGPLLFIHTCNCRNLRVVEYSHLDPYIE